MEKKGDVSVHIMSRLKAGETAEEAKKRISDTLFKRFGEKAATVIGGEYVNVFFRDEKLSELLKEIGPCEAVCAEETFIVRYAKKRLGYVCENIASSFSDDSLRKMILAHYYTYECAENIFTGEKNTFGKEEISAAREKLAEKFYEYDRKTVETTIDTESYKALVKILN